jgi:hypothetical protein
VAQTFPFSIIDKPIQVEYLEHLSSAEVTRCVSLNHDERIDMQPQDPAIEDALHCGNIERIVPVGTLLHSTILTFLSRAAKKGDIRDERGEGRRSKSVRELYALFEREVKSGNIHLAETRTRHMAYIVNEMTTSRLVAHDVGEQLMRYKSEGSANAMVAKEFLVHCSKFQYIGEVPLAMMIHKMYASDERPVMYDAARISTQVRDGITSLFDRNGTTVSLPSKIEKLQELQRNARVGFFDEEFLQTKEVPIHRAIVFSFPSLLDGIMFSIANRRVSFRHEREVWERVADDARRQVDALPDDPSEYILLKEVTLSNPIVVHPREWVHKMGLDPASMLDDMRTYYRSL